MHDATAIDDDDAHARGIRAERFADGTSRHHFQCAVLAERVAMIVSGEDMRHTAASEEVEEFAAAGERQVVVLVRLVRAREKPRMMLKHNDARILAARCAELRPKPRFLRRRFGRCERWLLE